MSLGCTPTLGGGGGCLFSKNSIGYFRSGPIGIFPVIEMCMKDQRDIGNRIHSMIILWDCFTVLVGRILLIILSGRWGVSWL